MTKEKPVWDKKDPDKGKHTKLSKSQKSSARAKAKAAGRPYPNLIDNMAVAKKNKPPKNTGKTT
jgi:hypothetical protein